MYAIRGKLVNKINKFWDYLDNKLGIVNEDPEFSAAAKAAKKKEDEEKLALEELRKQMETQEVQGLGLLPERGIYPTGWVK